MQLRFLGYLFKEYNKSIRRYFDVTCRALVTDIGPAFCLAGGCDAVQYSSSQPQRCSEASSNEFSCKTMSHISSGHWASFSAATNWTFICLVCDFPRDLTRRWRTFGEEIYQINIHHLVFLCFCCAIPFIIIKNRIEIFHVPGGTPLLDWAMFWAIGTGD